MNSGKKTIDTRGLVIVLGLLMIVVVALIVVNVIVLTTDTGDIVANLGEDNLARECLMKEDDASIEYCLSGKAFAFIDEGDCEKALKVYDDIPVEIYDKRHLSYLYDEAYSLSLSCEDESLETYWLNKLNNMTEQLEAID